MESNCKSIAILMNRMLNQIDSKDSVDCGQQVSARKLSDDRPMASMASMGSPTHSQCLTSMTSELCLLCWTSDCVDSHMDVLKPTTGAFSTVANEVIALLLQNLNFEDLSVLSLTNKWFRDFIVDYFFKSNTGFQSLVKGFGSADSTRSADQQRTRVQLFSQLGLLVKRITCLYPTITRIEILIQLFNRLDGIPSPTLSAKESQNMRFVFQCYGQLIHKLIAGWDDSEVKHVFKVLKTVTHLDQQIEKLKTNPIGARQPIEYFVRSFCRLICLDPIQRQRKSRTINDSLFWLKQILKAYPLPFRAKLLIIIYGPLISLTPSPESLPYIGWWDLTDTFFIHSGLEELGFALFMLYSSEEKDSVEDKCRTKCKKSYVIALIELMIKIPQNWLLENVATLLFYAGDDITHQFLLTKMKIGNYAESAQILIYSALIAFKLTKDTKSVYDLIGRFSTGAHIQSLVNELPIALNEAITDIDAAIEIEDERDVTELNEIISANCDLMRILLTKQFCESALESKDSQLSNEMDSESVED